MTTLVLRYLIDLPHNTGTFNAWNSLLLGVIYSTDFRLLRWKVCSSLAKIRQNLSSLAGSCACNCVHTQREGHLSAVGFLRALHVVRGTIFDVLSWWCLFRSSYSPYWAMPENLAFSIFFMGVYSIVIALLKVIDLQLFPSFTHVVK